MPEDTDKTTWLSKKIQLWILIVSTISGTGGLVYAADQYLNKFATNEDVQAVQMQFTGLYYETQISGYEEEKLNIQDKIVDGTATNADLKKKHRLESKIRSLEKSLNNLQNLQ